MLAACTVDTGYVEACEDAISAYAAALVAAGVPLAVANQSFIELRAEVAALNGGDPTFLAAIDGVFETLLPDSGAVGGGGAASPTIPG